MRTSKGLLLRLAVLCGLQMANGAGLGFGQNFGNSVHDRSRPILPLTLTVTHRGIFPAAITVPAGRYGIRFRNGLTKDSITFSVSDAAKARNGRVTIAKDRQRGGGYFDLDAGTTYEVTVEGLAGAKAQIVVTR